MVTCLTTEFCKSSGSRGNPEDSPCRQEPSNYFYTLSAVWVQSFSFCKRDGVRNSAHAQPKMVIAKIGGKSAPPDNADKDGNIQK